MKIEIELQELEKLRESAKEVRMVSMTKYKYIGDRFTSPEYKGKECKAIRNKVGKCARGRNGTMLVSFNGRPVTVVARLLRKIKTAI